MLSAKLNQTYQFIRRYILKYGIAPTEKEIAQGIGIKSRGVVHRYVHALVDAGLLNIIARKKRNIRLVNDRTVLSGSLPIIGEIVAGCPVKLIETDERLDISHLLTAPNRYVLKVSDDSYQTTQLRCGDYIICERRDKIETGDIIIAIANEKELILAQLKSQTENETILAPINNTLSDDICYANKQLKIEGIYLGMIRFNKSITLTNEKESAPETAMEAEAPE